MFLAAELGISFASAARIWRKWTAAIGAYNDRYQPFAWTKDADELLAKIRPSKN